MRLLRPALVVTLALTSFACSDDADETPAPVENEDEIDGDDGNGALDGAEDDGNGALDGAEDDGNGALDGADDGG